MKKRTRALDISPKVKRAVWERDSHICILCGSPYAMPNAHYIPRSHGGLGIEENVVTLCFNCHARYDNSSDREIIKTQIRAYLNGKYQNRNESELYYKKWS